MYHQGIYFCKKDESFTQALIESEYLLKKFPSIAFVEKKQLLGQLGNFEFIKFLRNKIVFQPSLEKKLNFKRPEKLGNILKDKKYNFLLGPAGTGKTTLVKELIALNQDKKITLLTPSHKANSNYYKLDGVHVDTIQNKFLNNSVFLGDLLIIDEISMVVQEQWEYLCSFPGAILFVGDQEQLKPIGDYAFLRELTEVIKTQYKMCTFLKKIERTNDEKLKSFYKDVRNKKTNPGVRQQVFDYYVSDLDFLDKLKKYNNKIIEVCECVNNSFCIHNNKLIISPIKKGIFGSRFLSIYLRKSGEKLNEGDEIIFIKNYMGFKNNEVMKIAHVEKVGKITTLKFETNIPTKKEVSYEYPPIEVFKTITVHRAQGSTFKNVIFVIPPGHMLEHDLFYTAISRASKNLTILAADDFNYSDQVKIQNLDENAISLLKDRL